MTFALVKVVNNTLVNSDGTVRSWAPNSLPPPTTYHWDARPAGTAGAYEAVAIDGGTVAYNPSGSEVIVFPFKASVPNAPGCSALGLEPL